MVRLVLAVLLSLVCTYTWVVTIYYILGSNLVGLALTFFGVWQITERIAGLVDWGFRPPNE